MTERSVSKTRKLTAAAILAAAAYLLAFLEFPVPLTPAFARMDLSDLPALIGAFAFGPVTGVMVELVKNLLGLMTSSTGEFIPFIHTKLDVVLYNAFPFNVLKGLVITAVTMLIYKKLSAILKGSGK